MTTAPACGIIVFEYLCIIYPTFVPPCFPRSVYAQKSPCISVYWRAHMRDLQRTAKMTGATSLLAVKIIDEVRLVNAQTHGINGFSLLRQWSCIRSCPATCLQCESKTTDECTVLTAVLWCSYRERCDTELTAVPACYRWMYRQWLTVLTHHWHCCICSYCHNIISSDSPQYSLNALVNYASVVAGLQNASNN